MTPILIEQQRGKVRWLTLNRPEKRNALNKELIGAISEALHRAGQDAEVRAIVITGAGERAFCAGADLEPGTAFGDLDLAIRTPYADLIRRARQLAKPLIARVNGACMAGGFGLLCVADFAVASSDAKFGLPEIKVGMYPAQVLSLLGTLVSDRFVREWSLLGEPFTAEDAQRAGLINYVVPFEGLDQKTEWIATKLIDKAPRVLARGKYMLAAMADMTFEQRLAFAEGQITLLASSEDAKEGLAAFVEKRLPVWSGA